MTMIYNDLALFTVVANHLSFSAAANEMNMTLSLVSRRIAQLEDHLGVKLFERTTRQVRLTEEGRRLLEHCQEPVEALQNISGFDSPARQPVIRITAPTLATRILLGPRLLDFAAQNPDIILDLTPTNTIMDFFRDNIDLAFRVGPLNDSNLVARKLWSVEYAFYVGEAFAARHKLSQAITCQQLLQLPAIISRQPWLDDKGVRLKPKNTVQLFDDLDLVCEATRRNLGVAMLPKAMQTDEMREIELTDTKLLLWDMHAVYPDKRLLPARVRRLIDFMLSYPPRRSSMATAGSFLPSRNSRNAPPPVEI